MADFLFGWITRPRMMVSFLDVVTASVELLLLTYIGLRAVLFWEKIYMKTHRYNIHTQKWEKKS